MNNYIEAATKLLDLSGAQYFIAHASLDAPLFGPKKATKLLASSSTKVKHLRPTRKQHASKWRALLADIPRGESKDMALPEDVAISTWQSRVAGAACAIFGAGNYETKKVSDNVIRLTRL